MKKKRKKPLTPPSVDVKWDRGVKWYRCKTHNLQTPSYLKTEVEQLEVQGFKYDDSPYVWQLSAEYEHTTCLQLLTKFRGEWRWFQKPNAFAREGNNFIISVYTKGFYISIQRTELCGPHAARLYYRSWQDTGEIAWVAICQLEALWHSDVAMLKALNHEIKNKRLYQSLETAMTIVLK